MKTSLSSFLSGLVLSCIAAAFVLLATGVARADGYTVTISQSGSNVVASGSGSLNLSGLTLYATGTSAPADMNPSLGYINTGPTSVGLYIYTGFTGPTSFGTGSGGVATSGSGDSVEILGSVVANYNNAPWLFVPTGYVSGTALSDTATYAGATFSSLGLTRGTYIWTWGSGPNQSFTLAIASEPGSLLLLATGLLALGVLLVARRRLRALP